MQNKKTLHHLTKILMDFMFYSGILVCASVPVIIYKLIPHALIAEGIRLQLTAVLMLSGIAALYILWTLRCIFQTLLHTDPFTMKNVDALRKMAAASFVISALYITKCLFWFTLATAIIVIIFAIAGLFSLVLADVFKQAVQYKEENDLTV
ncbi:hypothetical protein Psch_04129 [Pelotomaculum schinkii]|uniref:DUF2975 domain-containing protein n=1 Tax=Pelotomaculum schinkii TaxID=78350 RepID=A0A4Y7R6P1_9FIRM|nr:MULTISPECIES: DUF2975 domain-containing protein [Pelotomaculum]TEB04402.1 hypothetical protein Psch_04129 [Pelotomaculum schinkii]TEB15249.1 hypothetical protein Psfp_02286 [Pelotomaculum sp. FP]